MCSPTANSGRQIGRACVGKESSSLCDWSSDVCSSDLVRDLAQGLIITLIPHDQELTTKEAADILGISRPFLVKLLDRSEIPHHRVGTHRRLNVADVLAYRELRAADRKSVCRERV